jgi:chemotaxis family two-component system response regulator Rcp1
MEKPVEAVPTDEQRTHENPLRILIAEDNRADSYLIRQAFSREKTACDLRILEDGDEVLQFLMKLGEPQESPLPDIIVLDLNLPKRDGAELLAAIRAHEMLKHMTVAIVSSSPEEVAMKSVAQADCYIRKPTKLAQFLAIGREILDCYRSAKAKKACGA